MRPTDPPKKLVKFGPWYHGGESSAVYHGEQTRWDRDRAVSSANQEGPGIYFTSKFEDARSYGPVVVRMELSKKAKLLTPSTKSSMSMLLKIFNACDENTQANFLSNWDEMGTGRVSPAMVLRKYVHSYNSALDDILILANDLALDGREYIYAVRATGYDGAVVPRSYGVTHLILWNPKAIEGIGEVSGPAAKPARKPAKRTAKPKTGKKAGRKTVRVTLKEAIPGGLASGMKPSDFPVRALAEGTRVEMEHTTSKKVAQEIAMDHLAEDPAYYKKLKKMEKK